MTTCLIAEVDGGVLRLVLNRPERLNALDAATADALIAALVAARTDDAIRCVTITSRGRAFCAGADTGSDLPVESMLPTATVSLLGDGTPSTAGAVPMLDRANLLAVALSKVQVPVVAGVRGVALGLGASLALGSDLLVMGALARLQLGFSRIGLIPDGGASLHLRQRVGIGPALALGLLDEPLDGPTAVARGVATRCVDDTQVEAEVDSMARQIAGGPIDAHRHLKASLRNPVSSELGAALVLETQQQLELIQGLASATASHATDTPASVASTTESRNVHA